MSWDSVGHSIEKDVHRVVAGVLLTAVGVGWALGVTWDILRHRHQQ